MREYLVFFAMNLIVVLALGSGILLGLRIETDDHTKWDPAAFNVAFRELTDEINKHCAVPSTPLTLFATGMIVRPQDLLQSIRHARSTLRFCAVPPQEGTDVQAISGTHTFTGVTANGTVVPVPHTHTFDDHLARDSK